MSSYRNKLLFHPCAYVRRVGSYYYLLKRSGNNVDQGGCRQATFHRLGFYSSHKTFSYVTGGKDSISS